MYKNFIYCISLLLSLVCLSASGAEDLKTYYEQQKAQFIPTFKPPQLGSEVTLKIASGRTRSGILMKLSADSISVMTDSGTVNYNRTALHESSRAQFFAEDFAQVKALEKTREYKQQLHLEGVAEQQAGAHDARLSISSKIEKSSDKDVEEEEKDNEKTGNTITTTTTTRTYTEIQNLQVTVVNNTTHADEYTLVWCFIGKATPSDAVSIHDNGTKKITVQGRSRSQEKITSEPFITEKVSVSRENSNSSYSRDPRVTESGDEIAGWIIQLKFGNEVLDQKASSNAYLSDEWLNKL